MRDRPRTPAHRQPPERGCSACGSLGPHTRHSHSSSSWRAGKTERSTQNLLDDLSLQVCVGPWQGGRTCSDAGRGRDVSSPRSPEKGPFSPRTSGAGRK